VKGALAILVLSVIFPACSRDKDVPRARAVAPATRIATVTDTLHGVRITDDYRWLEEDSAEVTTWTDAQNAYTRAVLDSLPGRKAVEDRLRVLLQVGSVTAPIMRGNRYFFARRAATQDQPVIFARDGALGADVPLVDPNRFDASGRTAVAWFSPSEDGKLLAYGTFQAGDRVTTLRMMDVESGRPLSLEIPNTLQGVQWLPDGSGFVYQNLKDPQDPFTRQGLFHRMGTDPASDALLYRQFTKTESPRLAQTGGPSGTLSRDGRWLVLSYWIDASSNDLWLADFADFRRRGRFAARTVSVGVPGHAFGTVIGDTLFLHTTKGAPRGRVLAVNTARPEQAHWREIVAERPDAVIQAVAFGRGTIAITYLRNASSAIDLFDFSGKPLGTLTQPGIGSATLTAGEDRSEGYLTFSSFNYPPTVFRIDLAAPSAPPRYWGGPDVPIDPSSVVVEQVWYPSKDGTKVSMFVVSRKGVPPSPDRATLLTGYGALGINVVPEFAAPFFQWFEAGGALAVANLRGGGEYGDSWHQAGMLNRKQNSIDDFIAAAEWLIANKYTGAHKLAAYGSSHGGLVVGAAIVQRPELFRAAVLQTPLLDMLRYHNFVRDPYWAAEYGSPDVLEHFKWLQGYSPYQRVTPGTKYPAFLITAQQEEAEVHPSHARKMVAMLRAATAADKFKQPVLLRIDRRPGEDRASLLSLELSDVVDQRMFVMWQLGVVR
jgi:prolyl oligopeptidase